VTNSDAAGSASVRISTRDLPPPRRLDALRELFDRSICMEIDAQPGQVLDMEMRTAPGLRRARMLSSLTARVTRSPARLADGEDTMCLMINTGGTIALRQGRNQGVPRTGDAVLLVYRQAALLEFDQSTYMAIRVPYNAVSPMAQVEAAAGRCIPRETQALALLRGYVASLPAQRQDPQIERLVSTHVHDLLSMAIGPTREGRELAIQRGVRAARLKAIQAAVAQDTTLKIDQLAASQGISPRYVQMLFEEQGTTFSEFVLERRLNSAWQMLRSARYADWSIMAIALEAGFGDLSHFNRRFKQRYLMTPSEVRAQSRQPRGVEPNPFSANPKLG
jgi:AraC-like DNA-binding protein